MMNKSENRRNFIKKTGMTGAALYLGGVLPGFSAASYRRIAGANKRVNVVVMGVNSRGLALAGNFAAQDNFEVTYICDVDEQAAARCIGKVEEVQGRRPKAEPDLRKVLQYNGVDALVTAAPDHWHAPATILASNAGKHVYVEKPLSHSPQEGELVVAAAKKHGNVIQMGNQRRTWPNVVEAINALHQGVIGRVYFAKTWYANNRPSIGIGKKTAVPKGLDFDLWQGPAPRRDFQDNLVHYNWHWFWHWGTGEAMGNGVHTVDLARWGMKLDYPNTVSSVGGRYRYRDDWETPDTQSIQLDYGDKGLITWEGRSCNSRFVDGASVGVLFYGEEGTLQIEGGNAYKIYDLKNKLVKEVKNDVALDTLNRTSPSQTLDAIHLQNFFDAITKGTAPAANVEDGHVSTLLVQLGNIALRTGQQLSIDPSNGHILQNEAAQELWKRSYEPGWEPGIS
ncbi:Gfo/Idh/MocA family oxidoreductase [Olivibacter sp. SDN3]|nr:Gfo/Idh/MocA family oxidoreductase [Olivibacter sp. SDN3]